MKIYVASSFQNRHNAKDLMTLLEASGHEIMTDWTEIDSAATFEEAEEVGLIEDQGLTSCEAFVLLLPGGLGAHFEFGKVHGLGKPCYVIGTKEQMVRPDGRPVAFYFLPGVTRLPSVGTLMEVLAE